MLVELILIFAGCLLSSLTVGITCGRLLSWLDMRRIFPMLDLPWNWRLLCGLEAYRRWVNDREQTAL